MKFSWLRSFKIPGLQKRTVAPPTRAQQQARSLRAATTLHRARSRAAYAEEDDDMEPEETTTRLSTAFIVVVALHVVLVGGIYTFNSIKANRPALSAAPVEKPAPVTAPSAAATVKPMPVTNDKPVATTLPAAPSAPMMPERVATNPTMPVSGAHLHKVKTGETLTKIAAQYKISTAELAASNNMKESSPVRVGQMLNVPAAKPVVTGDRDAFVRSLEQKNANPPAKAPTGPTKVIPKTHTMAKGETLMAVTRKYGITYDELVKLNKIDDPRKLQIGQVLKLPQPKSAN